MTDLYQSTEGFSILLWVNGLMEEYVVWPEKQDDLRYISSSGHSICCDQPGL